MSTRSMIAYDDGNSVRMIYCHYDGYPDYNGKILAKHYTDPEKVKQLIDLGALSILGEEIGEKQDFDRGQTDNWCLAYGRDRGEDGCEARKYINLGYAVNVFNASGNDYMYAFDGKEWRYRHSGAKYWRSLSETMFEITPEADIYGDNALDEDFA
jgi:hypothetical protein